ncbi:MAG: hypothetical protein H0W86_05210, partial [Armatimonadetes bacterium]|nr:hypothetical protein [Armatimonadota bacterium]
ARVLIRIDRVHDYYRSLDEILSSLRSQFMERRRGYFAAEAAMFAEVLESGMRAGVFSFDDALDTANVLLTATNSLLPHSLTVREMSEGLQIEERTNQVSEILVRGLTNKGGKL